MHIGAVLKGKMFFPRPILAKFLYRPECIATIKKKTDLKNKARILEDLI